MDKYIIYTIERIEFYINQKILLKCLMYLLKFYKDGITKDTLKVYRNLKLGKYKKSISDNKDVNQL